MGNALSYKPETNKLKISRSDDEDATILTKYVNKFFKELPHEYANSNKFDRDDISDPTQARLKKIYENPMRARACCLQQNYIPIALPYVYPYKKDGGFACGNNNDCKSNNCDSDKKCTVFNGAEDVIKTTYAKVEVFNNDEYKSQCGENSVFGFNMKPSFTKKTASNKKYTADDPDKGTTLCDKFIGTVDFNAKPRKSSGYGICDKIMEDRKLSKPNNQLYQFYGEQIHDTQQEDWFLDKGYKPRNRTIDTDSKNAYPECSCTNSTYLRTPVTDKETGAKLTKTQTYQMQQNSDGYCMKADGNAFVTLVNLKSISMCVNIQNNLNALADGGSKINIHQTCSSKVDVSEDVNTGTNTDKANGMADDDDKAPTKKIADDKAAKKIEDDKAAAKKITDAKKIANAKIALNKKIAALKAIESAKTDNMMIIGGGVFLVVIIIFIVLIPSGDNSKKDEDDDE